MQIPILSERCARPFEKQGLSSKNGKLFCNGCFDDFREGEGFEACAANESAVNVGLAQECRGVGGLHAAPVLDSHL